MNHIQTVSVVARLKVEVEVEVVVVEVVVVIADFGGGEIKLHPLGPAPVAAP